MKDEETIQHDISRLIRDKMNGCDWKEIHDKFYEPEKLLNESRQQVMECKISKNVNTKT